MVKHKILTEIIQAEQKWKKKTWLKQRQSKINTLKNWPDNRNAND